MIHHPFRTALALMLITAAHMATAATNIVTTTADGGPGSLRQVISNSVSGDTIIFATNLSGATILLTNYSFYLNKSLTIDASALPDGIQINGNHTNSVFKVEMGTSNVMTALTITNGYAYYYSLIASGDGGGVLNYGILTMNRCSVVGNESNPIGYQGGGGTGGGGIANEGRLTLNQCIVAGNSSTHRGGGIYNNGILIVNGSTISGNGSSNCVSGGGIYNSREVCSATCGNDNAIVILNQSTLSGNVAQHGSAIGATRLIYARSGAVIGFVKPVLINQSTVSGNIALHSSGTALSGGTALYGGSFILSNSIVAGNTSPLGSGANVSQYALLASSSTNYVIDVAPNLSPLGNYGGLTQTMPPLPGSPAIDNGSDTVTNVFASDQRGMPRLAGLRVDAGAVESAVAPGAPQIVTQPATGIGPTVATLNATVTPNGAVTTCYFQYGTTTNYGSTTPIIAWSGGIASLSNSLTGLSPETTYHFRAVCTNNLGAMFGDDLSFQTGQQRIVTNTNDSGPGSLRDAVGNFAAGDSIAFATNLSGSTILLTNGEITLDKSLAVDASPLPGGLTISGNTNGRIFQVTSSNIVVLDSLTLINGKTSGYGGGISNEGTLTLIRCVVAGNTATNGGGIYNVGTLTLNKCTVAGNTAINGGGIYSQGLLTGLTVCQSTLSSNSATSGGGIFNWSTMVLNQSTLSGNSATYGGGIYIRSGAALNQSTVSGNSGGGIRLNSHVTIFNSIVAGNISYNYVSDFNSTLARFGENITDGDPLLAPLGNYGGPTLTMPPFPFSPAVDGCTNGTIPNTSFITDQRDFPRPVDGNGDTIAVADIGAVEGYVFSDGPGMLTGVKKLANGMFQLGFPNYSGLSYTVLASTNVTAPLNTWSNLGPAIEVPAGTGQYQFTDPQATNNPQRFYRVSSP